MALTCIACKNTTGFNVGSNASPQKHNINVHGELKAALSSSIPDLKSNLADLCAAVSIATNVLFAFFEHPAVLEMFNQVSMLSILLHDEKKVLFLQKYI